MNREQLVADLCKRVRALIREIDKNPGAPLPAGRYTDIGYIEYLLTHIETHSERA